MQRAEADGAEGSGEEGGPQTRPGPEPDVPTPQLHPDHRGADDYSAAATELVQENVHAALTVHLSNLNQSEDMEDQEPLPEEEEEEDEEDDDEDDDDNKFIILDCDHPLVTRQQAALKSQLIKQLERIDLELKEKLATEKADKNYIQEIGVDMFRVQEQLASLQTRLDDRHHAKAQAEAKLQQTQDQLEAMKSKCSSVTSQHGKIKASVSQLQTELEKLMLHLVFTQEHSEDLRSNVKAMKYARRKAGAEKDQAEDQKLKQDLYVERLTKDMERLTQQIAMYDAQAGAQAEETQEAKEALSEAEMEMESLVMARKQLLQQWSSSLVGIRRRNEAFSAMQDAVRAAEHQMILLDRELDGYKRSTNEEQDQNEMLTMQLNWCQMEGATTKKLLSQKQARQEALQAQYSTCLRTLRETESTLARLSKETSTHQVEMKDQRKQLSKESAVRLEMEDKIMTHIQQELSYKKAAKYTQHLISKIAALKREKISQLWQLENDVWDVGLESSEIRQRLDSLTVTQEALDEEIANYNKLLTSSQTEISAFVKLIRHKQGTIANYNKKICEIVASTGTEDLCPLQIKVDALMAQIKELAVNVKSDQQLWMKRQGTLIGLTQEIEANSKDMLKLQIEYTGMQQKKIRLESQIEVEHREERELDKNARMLKGDLLKLNTLLSTNGQLSQALEQENALMETDFLRRLKEAEREAIEMQMTHEKTQEEKDRLLNCLVESERQIMLWEKKIQLVKETRSALASETCQGDINMMKIEIHRMEVRVDRLKKQQMLLLKESEATVARRETVVRRREAIRRNPHKQNTKGELNRVIQGLHRNIRDTHKRVADCEQVIWELQESQVSLSNRLPQLKQQLIELCGTSHVLDTDLENLEDTKDTKLIHLVALQNRTRKLQGLRGGRYQASSTSKSIGAALQTQMERVHAVSTILLRVCEEFPQHQAALRRLSLELAARTWAPEQGTP